MIILGIILLVIGFVIKIAFLWAVGIILLLIGVILALLGSAGRMVGGAAGTTGNATQPGVPVAFARPSPNGRHPVTLPARVHSDRPLFCSRCRLIRASRADRCRPEPRLAGHGVVRPLAARAWCRKSTRLPAGCCYRAAVGPMTGQG